jgi:hypothetical protein
MFGLRLVVTAGQHGPFIVTDEIGYLANARVLAGGAPLNLSTWPFYHGGYSLFLVPAFWLSHDPATIYRIVLIIGAVISALVFPLTYVLLRDLGRDRRVAYAAAFVAALAPDAVFSVAYAMSEVLLTPLVIAWIWCTVRTARPEVSVRVRTCWAAAAGACIALLYATHVRGAVLAVIGLLALAVASRVAGWRPALAGIAVGLVGIAGASWMNHWLARINWPSGSAGVHLSGDLWSGHGIWRVFGVTVGQLWYATVASACLVPLGAMWAVADIRRAHGPDRFRRFIAAALGIGALFGIAVGVAAVAGDPNTSNWFVYGRYVAVVIPLFVAWGVAALLDRRTRLRRLFIVISAACVPILYAAVRAYAGTKISQPNTNIITDPTVVIMARPFTDSSLFVLHIGIVSAVALAVFAVAVVAVAARLRTVAVTALVVCSVACVAGAIGQISRFLDSNNFPHGRTAMQIDAVTKAKHLGWDLQTNSAIWRYRYAYYVENGDVEPFNSAAGPPPENADTVISGPNWNGAKFGYRRLMIAPGWNAAGIWVKR